MFGNARCRKSPKGAVAAVLALGLSACVAARPPQLASAPPIPAGDARLWFYRDFLPDDTWTEPAIAMNGGYVGLGIPGTSFYRDVPAGGYHITVDSYGRDLYQFQDVAVRPGQQQFIKIQSLPSWEHDNRNYRRPTYYVAVMPPQIAALEMSQTNFSGNY